MEQTNHISLSEKIFILKKVIIFSHTDESVLKKIAEALVEIKVKRDENIFQKGDEGRKMYIIISGAVLIHDAEYIFATLKRKEVFGEYALLDTEVRSASATAYEDSILLVLDQNTFYGIMIKHIEILQGILQVLVGRSRQHNKLQEDLAREKETIRKQNEEIVLHNEEILARNEEIIQQREQIEQQNALLQDKNILITSSIDYAQQIQAAALPNMGEIKKLLPQSFIFYQAKDIVSGDFYWLCDLTKPEVPYSKFIIAAIDCTGHGVPGAFMSLLGMSYLNRIVEFQGVTDVSEILKELNEHIRIALKQRTSSNQDGMELALCLIDTERKVVEVSGAKSPLFYIQGGELHVVPGSNFPIGGFQMEEDERRYVKHIIPYDSSTIFYMFSDGYRDQFSHKTNKKFLMKRFKKLFLDIYTLSMEEQYHIIKKQHEEWKGHFVQTDDIIVMGFKLDLNKAK